MPSVFRSRFGIPGVLAVVALVFAMAGGAWAAKKYVITSTKQIKPSVLKALKGKAGANGAPGAQGIPGAQGAPGPAGPSGKDGTNGLSVTSSSEPKGLNCKEGGSKFVGASGTTYACNGEPGPLLNTLPSGKSMTGAWGFGFGQGGAQLISFPFRLAAPLGESDVVFLNEGEGETTDCPGTAEDPKAAQGKLCLYTSVEEGLEYSDASIFPLLNVAGALVLINGEFGFGSWAVTAP
jgi:hypothetical protein